METRTHTVLDAGDIERSLKRMAYEILERNRGTERLMLLGIPTRGVPLAERLSTALKLAGGVEVPVGSLDVTMYRDDLRTNPIRSPHPTNIPDGGLDGAIVVLVDDVFYSGRTVRAALEAIADLGRPAAVQLAVLVDRGHRELPIRADYVGKNLPTSRSEKVRVNLEPVDASDYVAIEEA